MDPQPREPAKESNRRTPHRYVPATRKKDRSWADSFCPVLENDALRYVADLLGYRFLAYVVDVDHEQIRARIEGPTDRLDGHSEPALIATLEKASEWAPAPGSEAALAFPDGNKPDGSPEVRMRRFGWVDMDEEQSFANLLRLSAGGALPDVPQGLDPAELALAKAVLDYYPVTLIPVPRPDQPFSELPVISHARTEAFVQALSAEGSIDRLSEPGAHFFTSSGIGYQAPTPVRIMGCIVANAEQCARAFQTVAPIEFVNAAIDGLRVVRELCSVGRSVVPTQIGFGYVALASGQSLSGPRRGTLRAARASDLRVPLAPEPTMVLDTTSTLALHVGATPPPGGDFFAGTEEIALDGQLVCIAGLLALTTIEPRTLPLVVWEKVFDPLSPFVGSFKEDRGRVVNATLEQSQVEDFQRWLQALETHYHRSVRVAVGRCISAFAERATAEDALIDLVIALESLFGGSTELTFRISTALAWLLGEDVEQRAAIQRDAKRVYSARSKIVHGSELGSEEVSRNLERAEDLLVQAFSVLFTERTDLVAEDDRAAKLILGS